MVYRLVAFFVTFVLLPSVADSARILCIFPTPSRSHQIVFRPLVEELARRGHRMTVVTTDPTGYKDHGDLEGSIEEIDLSFSQETWQRWMEKVVTPGGDVDMREVLAEGIGALVEEQLSSAALRGALLAPSGYDLVVVEFGAYPAYFALARRFFLAPLIGVSSLDAHVVAHGLAGSPGHALQYPDSHFGHDLRPSVAGTLRFPWCFAAIAARARALGSNALTRVAYARAQLVQNELFKRYVTKDLGDVVMEDHVPDALFVNAHPALGFGRPTLSMYVDVTGIHMERPRPLDEDTQTLLDSATEGAILFSLGSNVQSESLQKDIQTTIIQVFSELPHILILWKCKQNPEEILPPNIRTFEWLPQTDILAHPNVKLLIFQGGYQSMVEAVTHKVPMIAMPFFGDQMLNAQRISYLNIGVELDLNQIEKDKFKDIIIDVIANEKYSDNIQRISSQLYDHPQSPLERAVWWTEYVLRHNGTSHLRPIVAELPWHEYLLLDLLAALVFWVVLVLGLIYLCCRSLKRIGKLKMN